ncbi:transcription factor bHLH25 [Arachis hypogaea]|uniref:transcription factor bHLH25 n=1 Tax=Arachis hypogaea TaxID=3818 RepID=UPI000DEC14BD|nr:transcription factor bHLH18 [Arachis hypogaea]XP_025671313.1 transcription factor bHLH18 [Arachis hypogaea]QHN94565.1 Transcription factor [Arachis hypogaea]
MEQCWENWPLHTEIEHHDHGDFFLSLEQCQKPPDDDDDFLREILQMPPDFIDNHSTVDLVTTGTTESAEGKRPRTFILSFDNSTIIPAMAEQQQPLGVGAGAATTTPLPSLSKKRNLPQKPQQARIPVPVPHPQPGAAKRSRNDSQIVDHIMAERKRRQQLTQMFIALSATIPGLKKTDKASILGEAINYVKQLQERVRELEKRNNDNKRGPTEPVIFLNKTQLLCRNNEDSTSEEEEEEDEEEEEVEDWRSKEEKQVLPDVEARMLEKEKEVLIEIHCEKENGIEVKILEQLENLHLSVTGSSVLPFGNSTLGITIIAKMGDAYTMTLHDLLTNLRQLLLINNTTDPY